MVMYDAERLDRIFAALADPTRRAIVQRLAAGGRLAVSDLAAPFRMSLPAVLKHVGVLGDAGLLAREKVGRTVYCRLEVAALRAAVQWLERHAKPLPGKLDTRDRQVEASPDEPRRAAAKPSRKAKPAAKRPATRPAAPSGRPAARSAARESTRRRR